MIIGIPSEKRSHETRISASPETVKSYVNSGFDVIVESGAGNGAYIADEQFIQAGAKIVKTAKEVFTKADILLKVWRPLTKNDPEKIDEVSYIKKGATVIALMQPHSAKEHVDSLNKNKNTVFSLELIPRISRAQSMDVLSSQANLAGYKAVIEAANLYGKAFPMMMTAAGTIAPAKVMVMGVGVAGLQAIATAKRLGAVVSATDVRIAAKEQVESLGGKFVMVQDEEATQAETAGGYAKEMSASYKKKQAKLIEETIKKQDIVITTALIPGKQAPVLITKEMVETMASGSIIIDLAVEQGGNCELSKAGEIVTTKNGVKIIGHLNMPARLSQDASVLFAKNMLNFVMLLKDKESQKLFIDMDDQIIKESCLAHEGKLLHSSVQPVKSVVKKKTVKETTSKKAASKKKSAPKKKLAETTAKNETKTTKGKSK